MAKRKHGKKLAVAAVGLGAAVALGFTGVALADSGSDAKEHPKSSSSKPPAKPGEGDRKGPPPGGKGGGMYGRGFGGPDALHGEVVVKDKDTKGKYETQAFQRGTVSSVSATSLVVKSEDGYTKTYVVNDNTKINGKAKNTAALKSGETVTVSATVSGSTVTATTVFDDSAKPTRPDHRPGK